MRGSVWLALLCYPAGPLGIACAAGARHHVARLLWTLGCAAILVHAASSFDVFYGWSHRVALEETARQVAEVTGRRVGAGIYLNYLFTLVWAADAAWWWLDANGYRRRSWIGVSLVHGFFLFMIFNATVIFEDGAVRVMGLVVTAAGATAGWKAVNRRRAQR